MARSFIRFFGKNSLQKRKSIGKTRNYFTITLRVSVRPSAKVTVTV